MISCARDSYRRSLPFGNDRQAEFTQIDLEMSFPKPETVFDVIEPFAAQLAVSGKTPFRRRAMLRLIGQALLVHHRMSGRIAIEEKPDVLWEKPELDRLYARLEDEYELKERAVALARVR